MFGDKKNKEEKLVQKDKNPKENAGESAPEEHSSVADPDVSLKESEYNRLVQEAAEYKDKYLRLFAEFDNARKRMDREKNEFVKYANEGLLSQFLNILDDLERSMEAAKKKHEDYAAFLKGIEMVMSHIYEVLKKNGVKPMESLGKKFDPHAHEPLMQEESNEKEEGTIVEEFQKGYLFGDKVLRTAKVKVTTAKQSENPENQEA